jgi:protein-S-isoprenylcysteine O-methyltransferase Ste14
VTRETIVSTTVMWIACAVALFAPAGRLDIPAFWAYLAVLAAISVISLFVIDPELTRERRRPGGRPIAPRYLLLPPLMLAHLIVAGLDRGPFHWSDMSGLLQALGLVVYTLGCAGFVWAMHVNQFFSSVPRIQSERGHRVVSAGPYQWVRHPGYTAALMITLASGIALGSWPATAIGAIGVPLIFWRLVFEDRMLHEELPGYRDYAARVPYRLIPLVW